MQDYVQGEITLQVDNINRLYHVLDPEQSGIQVSTTPGSDIVRIQYNMTYQDMTLLERNLKSAGNFIRFISNIPDTNGNGDHANQEYQGEEFFSGPQAGAIEYPEEHQYDQGQAEYGNTGYSRVYEENYNQPPVGDPHSQYYDPGMDNQYQGMNPGRKPQMQNPNPQMRPDIKGPGINQPPATMKRGPQYPGGQPDMMRGNPNLYDQKAPLQGGQNFKQYPNQSQQPQNPPYQPGPKGQPQQPPMRRPGPGGYQENPRDQYYEDQGSYYREMDQPDYYPDHGPKGNRPPNQGKPQPVMNPQAPQGPQGGRFPQGGKQPQANPAPQMMPGNQNQPYYGKAPQGQPPQGRGYPGGPQQRFPPGGEPSYQQDFRQPQGGQYQDEGPNYQQYPPRGGDKWAQPPQGGNNSGSNQGPGSKNSGSSGAQRSQGKPQVQSAQNTPNINYGHTGPINPNDKRGSAQAQVRGASANVPRGGHQGTGPNSSAGSQSGRGGHPGPVQSVAGQLHSSQKINKQQAANQSQQWAGKGNKKGIRDDGSVSSQSIGQSAGPESFSGSINPTGQQNPQRRGGPVESQEFGSPAISPPPNKDINLPKERFIDDTVENINRKPGFNKLKKKSTRRAQLLEEYLKGLAAGGGEPAPVVGQPVTSIGSISNMRVDMGSNVFVSSVALTDSNKADHSQQQSSPSVPHLDFTEQFDEEEDEERRRREAEHRAKQVAASGSLRQPLGEVGESDEINNDPEEQLESDGEEEEDFYGEEQFDPEFGEEEQPRAMTGPKEQPIAGGRFLATPGLHMSEVSRPKITNKGRAQPSPNDPRGGGSK